MGVTFVAIASECAERTMAHIVRVVEAFAEAMREAWAALACVVRKAAS